MFNNRKYQTDFVALFSAFLKVTAKEGEVSPTHFDFNAKEDTNVSIRKK
ncbi:hypothetical protein [Metabacillus fastidiosus]